jgi:hypothetical protein
LRRKWLSTSRAERDCAVCHPLGPEASSDMLRQSARCSKCGAKGATLMLSTTAGFAPFPVKQTHRASDDE